MISNYRFNTQPPEGGWAMRIIAEDYLGVSIHSRLKAAGLKMDDVSQFTMSFNTQPPEGGCYPSLVRPRLCCRFNTQPPEGGCFSLGLDERRWFGFNTQPPEGGWAY